MSLFIQLVSDIQWRTADCQFITANLSHFYTRGFHGMWCICITCDVHCCDVSVVLVSGPGLWHQLNVTDQLLLQVLQQIKTINVILMHWLYKPLSTISMLMLSTKKIQIKRVILMNLKIWKLSLMACGQSTTETSMDLTDCVIVLL